MTRTISGEMKELLSYIDRQMGYIHDSETTRNNPDWRLPYASDAIVILECDMCGESVRSASTIALSGVPCSCGMAMRIRRDRNAERVRLTPYTIARDGGQATVSEGVMG